jgi:hypothetical protein
MEGQERDSGFQSILLFILYMEPKNPYTDPLSAYKVLKGLTQPTLLFIPYMEHRNPLH